MIFFDTLDRLLTTDLDSSSLFILKTLAKLLYIPSAGSSVNSFFFYYGGLAVTGILLISREGLDG